MESGVFPPVEQENASNITATDKSEVFCQRTMMINDNSDVTRRRR